MEDIIQYLNEKMGIPSNVISVVSSITKVPLVSTTVTALTFFSIFAILWGYYYRKKSIDSLKEDELEKNEVELIVNNDKIERDLKYQYDRKKILEEEIRKTEGIFKDKYSKELEYVNNKIKVLESEYEDNLDRLSFVRNLKMIISHKKFLKEKGIWKQFEELSRKIEKENINIDKSILKRKEMREFLSSLNNEYELMRIFE
ncbi:hypothetical protein [Acidianus brierleyi]|nr:hypothetical protein [Acidianus brierleyi]AWR93994.2 hypothetical protein DFR85_04525 [Acidianus brierleyi]